MEFPLTDLINPEELKKAFLAEAEKKPNLSAALSDPIIDTIEGIFSQVIAYVAHRQDRSDQERFLMTATNRSSVLAKSEDRQYNPRKALSSVGTLTVTDKDNAYGGLPSGITLLSAGAVSYLTADTVTFDAEGKGYSGQLEGGGNNYAIPVKQIEQKEFFFDVATPEPFYSVTIPAEYSPRVSGIQVYVDIGSGYQPWEKSKRFRSVDAGDYVYDEFYSSADEHGVRFGTSTIGRIPTAGASIKLVVDLTDGETTLISGEKLKLADSVLYKNLEFVVDATIDGGAAQEDLESIRNNSLYYEIFDDQYVWDDDYAFLLRRQIPSLTWVKIWGEAHQTQINGDVLDTDFINKIYVSAYSPYSDTPLPAVYNLRTKEAVLNQLNGSVELGIKGIPNLNKRFEYVDPVEQTFTISISGTVQRNWTLSDAKNAILDYLKSDYGRDSSTRKDQPFKRDLYEGLKELKIFDSSYEVEVSITGVSTPANLKEFIYLDETATELAISLEYS